MTIDLRHHTDLTPEVRDDLLAVYADVRAPLLHLSNYSVEAFGERLERHVSEPGFGLVLGYDGGVPVGYAYGNTVEAGDRYWQRLADPLPAGYADAPVLAIKEVGVRTPWRGAGTARRIHDELLVGRPEGRVMLMVNPLAGGGKVLGVYESWGYRAVNSQRATSDSPRLLVMARPR
ncbi:GNAT family N-acetyltransferase [Streptomyces tateyamensis]|uniref:GNAT family N-acetyltransferase n=1 Tax=Streptomyces tateyamensis TaxID=565073 RepID=A0A2V4MZ36_9ACTN|nr:GNAT family N-acetyltransferase [Streptomyces tateyamensis]PYC63850.1 GNAT family N-acetyltransferase [Streptomyces tateyamensis]